ncbi:MAG: acyl-CoA thioesterase [Spirochaetaceae bacterium]|nr:acyl-CoA thioesterase [Spirochaetaceae bacterium]
MKHISHLTVRSYECDAYNHVNNAVYLNYLEYARMEFLKDYGFNYKEFVAQGYFIIVVRIAIDYKLSAVLDDVLTIETEPLKRRAASGVFRQRILRGDDLIAEAEITWATLNPQGKPSPIPREFEIPALNP